MTGPAADCSLLGFHRYLGSCSTRCFFLSLRRLSGAFREDEKRAEQGARANTTGCHGSCSEQHEPRQPVVWLTYDVRRKIIVGRVILRFTREVRKVCV